MSYYQSSLYERQQFQVIHCISEIYYFLYLPSGGYRGGRNPMYGIKVLFERHTWSDLHVWGGVLMMAAIAVHFAIHWQWVKRMSRRSVSALLAKNGSLSKGAKVNVAINLLVAFSFLLCAVSGLYFLFGPSGGYQGGRNRTGTQDLAPCKH